MDDGFPPCFGLFGFLSGFTSADSCGKCPLARECRQMLVMLTGSREVGEYVLEHRLLGHTVGRQLAKHANELFIRSWGGNSTQELTQQEE